ncbi:hypothetical protein L0156_19965, partial [bacterium]|nr:hypothetical protein [bacterium]
NHAGRMPAVIYASLEAGAPLMSAAILAALMSAGFQPAKISKTFKFLPAGGRRYKLFDNFVQNAKLQKSISHPFFQSTIVNFNLKFSLK